MHISINKLAQSMSTCQKFPEQRISFAGLSKRLSAQAEMPAELDWLRAHSNKGFNSHP